MGRHRDEVPPSLRDELRELAKRHGAVALVQECADLVREFAMKGMAAELADRKDVAAADCPRCRKRDALLEQTKAVLRRATSSAAAQGGAAGDGGG